MSIADDTDVDALLDDALDDNSEKPPPGKWGRRFRLAVKVLAVLIAIWLLPKVIPAVIRFAWQTAEKIWILVLRPLGLHGIYSPMTDFARWLVFWIAVVMFAVWLVRIARKAIRKGRETSNVRRGNTKIERLTWLYESSTPVMDRWGTLVLVFLLGGGVLLGIATIPTKADQNLQITQAYVACQQLTWENGDKVIVSTVASMKGCSTQFLDAILHPGDADAATITALKSSKEVVDRDYCFYSAHSSTIAVKCKNPDDSITTGFPDPPDWIFLAIVLVLLALVLIFVIGRRVRRKRSVDPSDSVASAIVL